MSKDEESTDISYSRGSSASKPQLNYPKCKALYDYNAADSDELTFRENDTIYILQEGK